MEKKHTVFFLSNVDVMAENADDAAAKFGRLDVGNLANGLSPGCEVSRYRTRIDSIVDDTGKYCDGWSPEDEH